MGSADLIRHLAHAGLRLEVDGARLVVWPAARLTDDIRALIREHKGELLRTLASAQDAGPPAGESQADEDDRITCSTCRHFRVVTTRCSNHVRAGMPFDLVPELTTMPQRCPGYAPLLTGPKRKESGPMPKESPPGRERGTIP